MRFEKSLLVEMLKKRRKIVLLFSAAILFALDSSFSAWFVLLPVLFLVKELTFKDAWLYGGIYGVLSSVLYATWLFSFSVPLMFCVCLLYFALYAVLFEVLEFSKRTFKSFAWLFYVLVLVLFEYAKTLGFSGFGYGINGYTQYRNIYLIQIADIFGVFGVSSILYLCSAVVFEVIKSVQEKRFSQRELFLLIMFFVLVSFSVVYGFVKVRLTESRDFSSEKITVAAIQHNPNPDGKNIASYINDVRVLMSLTDKALDENPGIELVVWPETAVIPSILLNYRNPALNERQKIVEELLFYIDSKNCAFVIGNFHSEKKDDYNSAYLFLPGKNVLPPNPYVYRKMHLVPFSEYLPFSEKLPRLKERINRKNNFLWTPGKERTVFALKTNDGKVFNFSSPICFEDTFGSDLKKFYKKGARAFVNLSNDAWSKSKRCQVQHLKMAVFRSVENHVPSVRSSASGETCIISSTGKIVARSESFRKNYVTGEIPVLH